MARAASLDTSSVIARARRVDGAKVIALNLGPLLAPHRKHGRLSLRIERLPQQARFTRGNRNNDGSWSFATDELEDLGYQLPEDFTQTHTLAIRIINLAGGNTLAVVEHQIAPGGVEDDEAAAGDGANEVQAQALREQLAQMKTALAARESELAEARQGAAKRTAAPPPAALARDTEAEIAAARTELQADFDARLAAVGAQAANELQKHRAAWTQELAARVAAQAGEAREAAERETQETFAKAKAAWKAEEAERLAEAEAAWRVTSEKALTELRAELRAAHGESQSAELDVMRASLQRESEDALAAAKAAWTKEEAARRAQAEAEWRAASENGSVARAEEIAALRQTLAREAEEALAKARAEWRKDEAIRLAAAEAEWRAAVQNEKDRSGEIDVLRAALAREAADALAKAEDNWKVGEAVRLAAKEAEWREENAKALAAARTQGSAQDDATQENQALREDMAALQAKLAGRDAALVQAQSAAETLKLAAEREKADAIVKAAAAWKAEEAGRLAAAQARWRAEAEEALTFARAPHGDAKVGDTAATEELRKKIGVLETMLAEREAALAEAREVIEQQTHAAQTKTQKDRKAENAARAAEAEAGWRSSYGNALAEATQRYEAAEAALAQVRLRTKDEGRLHQELASTRAALAAREKELADLRQHVAPLDGYAEGSAGGATAASEPTGKPQPYSRAFIGGVIAAACAVLAAIVFFPTMIAPRPAPIVEAPGVPALKEEMRLTPAAPAEKKARLTRDAKLRAEAVAGSRVVATVTKGSEVVVLEVQEKFTRVRFSGLRPVEGWVLPNALQEIPAEGK